LRRWPVFWTWLAISISCDIVHITAKTAHWLILVCKRSIRTHAWGKNPGRDCRQNGEPQHIRRGVLLGPRINAAGRIDDAKHAVELLIACDENWPAKKA